MHWYAKDGSPAHFQEDGKNTTLAHARKQALVPSVTGILDIVASPGLTNYFISQHLEAAWESEIDCWTDYDAWCKEVRQQAGEHSKQARDKGTDIHNALDNWYSGATIEVNPYVEAVTAALSNIYAIEVSNCTPERTFATEEYGGSVDLSRNTGYGEGYIFDYKYKSGGWECKKDGTPKKMWYENHVAQLAAYREGLGLPKAKCANVFISPEAEVYIHEWNEEELQWGWEYFKSCLKTWQIKNRWQR